MLQFYVKDSYVQYSFPASTNVGQSFAIIWSMWRHTLEAKAHKPQVREEKSSVRLFIKVLIIVQLAPEQYRSTYMGIFFFLAACGILVQRPGVKLHPCIGIPGTLNTGPPWKVQHMKVFFSPSTLLCLELLMDL